MASQPLRICLSKKKRVMKFECASAFTQMRQISNSRHTQQCSIFEELFKFQITFHSICGKDFRKIRSEGLAPVSMIMRQHVCCRLGWLRFNFHRYFAKINRFEIFFLVKWLTQWKKVKISISLPLCMCKCDYEWFADAIFSFSNPRQ